ncbi:hypothetical protein M153_1370003876 [Pseudoloma neurophilia]|uniref:Uncharacterized protein n=1 Tax=Pseudoloma neurophilia TaxID=146866 RepID=A0A0R0M926_9MICR|nr:hypothetical protein M153_1370003876 [Pseudoloma neurophilia]
MNSSTEERNILVSEICDSFEQLMVETRELSSNISYTFSNNFKFSERTNKKSSEKFTYASK